MKKYRYYQPTTLAEAFLLRQSNPEAQIVAGGTDLMVRIRKRELRPTAVISLRSVAELSGIQVENEIRIGALTTITEILSHQELGTHFPLLRSAAQRMASVQIRNVATVGGNLCNCSPCADTATPLLVLDARVRLASPKGAREVSLQDFFKGPGQSCLLKDEIMTDILLTAPPRTCATAFFKKGRVRMDLALVSVSVLLDLREDYCHRARIAAGSVAPVPLRLSKTEQLLEEKHVTVDLISQVQNQVATEISPISDIRASADYRRELVKVYVKRALENILGWSQT